VKGRGDVFGVLNDKTYHICHFLFTIILSGFEDGFALFKCNSKGHFETILHYLFSPMPYCPTRCGKSDEFALHEVDVAHWTYIQEILEAIIAKS
jgi:hypothetical protein